jgi:prenyltransferase beta subunit
MRRQLLFLVGVCLVAASTAAGQTPEDVKATIAYVQKLQTSTGGFLSMEPKPNIRLAPTLRATSSAVRALHYLGGKTPNEEACKKYVATCHDPATGGFKDMPGGMPDVFTTAVGIMAVVELKMPLKDYEDGAIKYLSDNAKGFEEIRIAVAGLERLGKKSPKNDDWLKEIKKASQRKTPDDSDGPTSGKARLAGSLIVTYLRLGVDPKGAEHILKWLQDGQRLNGGWGKEGTASSDLKTTYRVMRAFVMLKAQPKEVEGVRSFVAKCRNADGGYGISPGEDSTVSATYFAAIIRHWLKDMK